MENDLLTKLTVLEAKLDAVENKIERVRKYLQLIVWVTIGTVVIPLLILLVLVPIIMNSYLSSIGSLL